MDFVKAFDRVNRDLLFIILGKLGCPPKFIRIIRKLYTDVKFPPVMASFKETREALLLSHASGFIIVVEFLLLYEENMSDNLDFSYDEFPSFNFQDKNEAECKANFRVEKHHVSRLVDALDIPAVLITEVNKERFARKSEAVLPYRKINKN